MGANLRAGSTVAGYRIDSLIARGGMSIVYLAEDIRLGRMVALKLLAPELAADEGFRQRFIRESRVAAGLEHPNIVPVYEADEAGEHLFIAMRHVKGRDLGTIIADEGPMDPRLALVILRQIAGALDSAHEQGLVHRDVKPSNILVASPPDPGGAPHAYLSDFGIARHLSGGPRATLSGDVLGTADYMAPEQIEGQPVDGRTDVYSIGCVLYECLSAEPPFPRDNDVAVLWAHLRDPPPAVTAKRADLRPGMDTVVARAMAKSPSDRYGTCRELVAAGMTVAQPVPPVPQVIRSGARHRRRRSPRALAAALGAVVAVVVLSLALVLRPWDAGVPRDPASPGVDGFGSLASPGLEGPLVRSVARVDASGGTLSPFLSESLPSDRSAIAAGEGGLWVISPGGLTWIDEKTGQTAAVPGIEFEPTVVAVRVGDVWVAGRDADGNGWIAVVTSGLRSLVGRPERIGHPIDRLVWTPDGVWALDAATGTITIVHPVTRDALDVVEFPGNGHLQGGLGTVWAMDSQAKTLRRFEGSVTDPSLTVDIESLEDPQELVVTNQWVWVVDTTGAVFPFDAESGDPGPVISLPALAATGHVAVAATGHVAWIAGVDSVNRIDQSTLEPTSLTVDGGIVDIAADATQGRPSSERSLWVLLAEDGRTASEEP